ncbi:MAG TPA: sulfatase-like hydrolase/transferase [Actinomycetota bacterium]|nr:sulfatase-like hydrolase/transferase [Actinomycetota bacterium]
MAAARPNLVMVVVDSLRADVAYDARVPTPLLDSLRARGAAFRQCVSTTTTTTPSFSSMLTGCYPPKHGVRGLQGYRLSGTVTTMAEAFAAAGYETHAEVTGPLLPETAVLRGFADARHRAGYRAPFFGWRDDVLARMRGYARPWLLLLHLWEVHRPFRPPPTHEKRWDRAGYEAVVSASDERLRPVVEAAGDDALVVVTGDHGEEYPDSEWERLVLRAGRQARARLRPARWWPALDRRLAALATGHGFALHEHLVRVPLVIAGPGVAAREIADQVRHVDLFPTLADLCGVDAPGGIDGRSLRPLLEGKPLPPEPAYMEAVGVRLEGARIAAARTPEWKLVRPGGGRPALYRLDGAPDERRNLIGRHPEVAARLGEVIDRVEASGRVADSGMTRAEEAVVEQHLRDLGYL